MLNIIHVYTCILARVQCIYMTEAPRVLHFSAFIVTSADISQLWVYLCYLLMYSLRLFVVVYKLVMFMELG